MINIDIWYVVSLPVTLNTSYHVAAVYDGTNSLLKLYLNGTMVAKSISGSISPDTSLLQ
jgi:hypothetical protein